MVCPNCGACLPAGVGCCTSCGSATSPTSVAVAPVDTTGLPPGSSYGPVGLTGAVTRVPSLASLTGSLETGGATADLPHLSSVPAGPLPVGKDFSARYHIIRLLGAGGMGAVYQAWDEELGVAVALKVIRGDRRLGTVSSEAEKRFKTELLLARQVTHKHVVRIHDLGEINGIKYITMPYIQGRDLATTLRHDGALPLAGALRLLREIADGLRAAHEAGVVHRDLKPANIMISADGHASIMDFGISASTADTNSADAAGTPEYMAPEQARAEPVDARVDIYAFGLIAYEMLSGPRPSAAPGERLQSMWRRFEDGVPPLRGIDESIPPAVETFVMRCVERDPAARFQTTAELCAALSRIDDAGELIPELWRLTPRVITAAAVLVVMLFAGLYALIPPSPPKPHDPVSVLIADFQNRTGDATFDRTLEPMLKRALEGAGFISAYDRGAIRAALGVQPPDVLDDNAARELAVKQGLGVVLSGAIARRGDAYVVSMKATQTVTGATVTSAQRTAAGKDQVLAAATRVVTDVQTALGDESAESRQFAMASLSATSLDVVKYYAAAQEASSNGRFDEALENAARAVEIDPKFGVGYQLMAVQSRNLGRLQDSTNYINTALKYLDGMTERERFSTRAFFYRLTGDYQQCVKEYGELVSRYKGDVVGHNGLALCASQLRQLGPARDEMKQVVALLPNRALFRDNLALYSDYSGDFQTGEQEARKVGETDAYAVLALAFAQLGQNQLSDAVDTYNKLAAINTTGTTLAQSGLGDVAALQGRFAEAARMLSAAAAKDLAAKNPDRAAAKFAAAAFADLSRGQKRTAIDLAMKALAASHAVKIRFLAARLFIDAGSAERARPIAEELGRDLLAEPQAYGKILDADLMLAAGDPRGAIPTLGDANKLLDTWIGHFDLGRAYFEADAFIDADSEFDRCLKRKGEALALFLDEEPTYAFLPPVYYYQGRVREALKTAGFGESYRAYLALRGGSKEDPLVADVRKRLGS